MTLRRSFLPPIAEIFTAAELLHVASQAHLAGDRSRAEALIREADIPAIAAWTESIWGKIDAGIHRYHIVPGAPPNLAKHERPHPRMPDAATRCQVRERDGHFCRFCGIPTIDQPVRARIRKLYPEALRWGTRNPEQHAAFQCMWLQYDHVLPNSRGGDSSTTNVIVTCAPCNFGRGERILEEVGLIDPRSVPMERNWKLAGEWRGLEEFA